MERNPVNLLDKFQKYLEDNNSPVSVRGYLSDVRIFLAWFEQTKGYELTEAYLKREPHILNKAVIEAFVRKLHAEKKALNTVNRHISSLRVFGNFLADKEIVPVNPARKVEIKKLPLPAPRGLSDEDRYKLENIFRKPWERLTNKTGRVRELILAPKLIVRDRAIFMTLLYAGLRVSELTALDIEDIEIKKRSGKALVRMGKGGQPREVGLPKQVREALEEWLKLRKELGVKNHGLFVDLKMKHTRLSQRTIQNMLTEASERSGVQVTAHVLRHTYAYLLRKNGVQPEVRARLMGHSIEMALRYGSPKEEEMNKAVQSLDSETSF
jgi:site-specific recombinase XerD